METVRQPQPLQIAFARHPVKRPALMHQPVVDQEIEHAIQRHSRTDPLQRPYSGGANGDQHDSDPREYYGIHIV